MKINNINNINKINKAYKKSNMNRPEEDKRLKKKDQLTISKEAQEIQKAIEAAKNSPDIRREKVDEIKERIESGNYKIDPKQVAKKLLEDIYLRNNY